MKADHCGANLVQHVGGFVTERCSPGTRGQVANIETELPVIGRECRSPCGLAFDIGKGRRMAEEVDVEGLGRLCLDGRQFIAHGIEREHGAGQRAQPAGVGDCDSQSAALNAGHGRLNDRQLDVQK